jgi:hypothetical protein
MKDVTIVVDGQTIVFEVPTRTTHDDLVNAVVNGVQVIGGRPKRP